MKNNSLSNLDFESVSIHEPSYYFINKNWEELKRYSSYFSLSEITLTSKSWGPGMVSTHDQFAVSFSKSELEKKIDLFIKTDSEDHARQKWRLCSQKQWNYDKAKLELSKEHWQEKITSLNYRPFDRRMTVYDSNVFVHRRERVSTHFIGQDENIGICFCRQLVSDKFSHIFITKDITDDNYISNKSRERGYILPLYLSSEEFGSKRIINLKEKFLRTFISYIDIYDSTFDYIQIFDYIYTVLHSPAYREKYKEFLKIDFPRIPYPKDADTFWALVKLGGKLRQIHLLESDAVEKFITTYPQDGDNEITRRIVKKDWELYDLDNELGRIWINDQQYFDQIPLTAWEFYIGGYQPAQKWLKDRSGRTLSFEEIQHYQKIIVALRETDRLMQKIDKIDFF